MSAVFQPKGRFRRKSHYCYLPLYIFCGDHLLCARLRPADIDAGAGSVKQLRRIVEQIRQAWPEVKITIRADSGFCREAIMAWCEANGVDYVLGLAPLARCSALATTRRSRLQLSSVRYRRSVNTRQGSFVRSNSWRAWSCSAAIIAFSRVFCANPST